MRGSSLCVLLRIKKNNRNSVKSQCVNGDVSVKYKKANHSTVLFTVQHSTAQHMKYRYQCFFGKAPSIL